jgi:hypothetical protein
LCLLVRFSWRERSLGLPADCCFGSSTGGASSNTVAAGQTCSFLPHPSPLCVLTHGGCRGRAIGHRRGHQRVCNFAKEGAVLAVERSAGGESWYALWSAPAPPPRFFTSTFVLHWWQTISAVSYLVRFRSHTCTPHTPYRSPSAARQYQRRAPTLHARHAGRHRRRQLAGTAFSQD